MSNFIIRYNEKHMKQISMRYARDANKINDAHTRIERAATNINMYYKGGANEMIDEMAKAICEHLGLLEVCSKAMAKYVDNAYAEMIQQQEDIGQSFNGRN